MVTFLYNFGVTRMQVGFGSAVGVVLFVICVVFAFGYKRVMRDDDHALVTEPSRVADSRQADARSGRLRYAALFLVAGVVLVPLVATVARRLQDARRPARQSRSACRANGSGATTGTSWRARATGS